MSHHGLQLQPCRLRPVLTLNSLHSMPGKADVCSGGRRVLPPALLPPSLSFPANSSSGWTLRGYLRRCTELFLANSPLTASTHCICAGVLQQPINPHARTTQRACSAALSLSSRNLSRISTASWQLPASAASTSSCCTRMLCRGTGGVGFGEGIDGHTHDVAPQCVPCGRQCRQMHRTSLRLRSPALIKGSFCDMECMKRSRVTESRERARNSVNVCSPASWAA